MISLFIDTSDSDVSIALIRDQKILSKIHEDIPRKHSTYVVKFIEDILKENNITPQDVTEIIIINGPGSFTGVRIGVTIAKTYAYLLNIRIIPITSLLARVIGHKEDYLLSVIDAKHDNYYIGLYDKNYNTIIEKFGNSNEVMKLKEQYQAVVIDKTNAYNIEEIASYAKNLKSINPHAVNPVYLKLPQAMEEKQC